MATVTNLEWLALLDDEQLRAEVERRGRQLSPDADRMTLEQIEAIAARLDAAVKTFREARAILGGTTGAPPTPPTPVVSAVPTRVRTPMSEAEKRDLRAQRDALVARNRDDLPEGIRQAEEHA